MWVIPEENSRKQGQKSKRESEKNLCATVRTLTFCIKWVSHCRFLRREVTYYDLHWNAERQNGCLRRPYEYLRKEAKGKGEKKRYTHLNAEFQRIARRDKKAFLSDQCKEIEENNRMGKTRALIKKIIDTKGTFHAKMGSIKDRNGRDITEAEDIKKRWQEYTDELYKNDLYDPDNHDGVLTHLEQDILECEVKWALGSITTNKGSGGDGTPVELFQILKDDALKVLHSICQKIWKTQQRPQDW